MKLIIDCREHKLIEEINKLKIQMPEYSDIGTEIRQLDLGDFIIETQQNNILIERKTYNDLLASIKDGRYDEQSLRLAHLETPNHNIIYLMEGKISGSIKEKKTILSSLTSILLYKGFSILHTSSPSETAILLCQMCTKLSKDKTKPFYYNSNNNNNNNITDKSYSEVIKKVKKQNVSPSNISEIMLSQIPNVSSTISKIVIEKFGSINNLCSEIQNDEQCLVNLTCIDKSGKERKINKNALRNITEYLK